MSSVLMYTALGIFVLLAILIGLFGLLVVQQMQTERRRSKMDAAIEANREDWYACLIEGTVSADKLKPASRIETEAADEVLCRYRINFHSEKLNRRINDYTEAYMATYYRGLLRSKKWSMRMNGLRRISLLNLQFMAPDILEMAEKGRAYSKEELLLIYKFIAKTMPAEFMPYFINPAMPLGEFDYRRLLITLDAGQLILLESQFDELPPIMQHCLIDVIGSGHFLELLPLLEQCLESGDAEIRIRSLKAMASIHVFPENSYTAGLIYSPIWEERLMAAKLYANAPLQEAHEALAVLLADSVYQVRKQAAASLQAMRTGVPMLQKFIQQSDDSYVVDMAAEMIGKR